MADELDPTLEFRDIADPVQAETARLEAYHRLFGSRLGRAVLADIIVSAGATQPMGPPGGPGTADYLAGLRDTALTIAATAGLSRSRVAQAIMTHGEEGFYDERREFPDA